MKNCFFGRSVFPNFLNFLIFLNSFSWGKTSTLKGCPDPNQGFQPLASRGSPSPSKRGPGGVHPITRTIKTIPI